MNQRPGKERRPTSDAEGEPTRPASSMPDSTRLRRSLSLPLITLYGLGTTIGAGIYVLVGKVAGRAALFAPVSFLVAALIAGLSAFSFAELSSRYPKSAGEALYVREGLGSPALALVVGLLVVVTGIVSAAAIVAGAAGYGQQFAPLSTWLLILLATLLLGGLAAWGIGESVAAAAVLTLVEIGGLVLVVWVAMEGLADSEHRLPDLLPPFELAAWQGVLAGAILAFYAFIGFEDMVNVAEEVKNVRRTLPIAIVLTLALTLLLYVAVTVVAVLTVPVAELAASEAPLTLLYERAGGGSPATITAIAIFATLNGALIQIIMASRVLYGLSGQQALPAVLGRVNRVTRTPLAATAVASLAVLALALWLPIETLAQATAMIVLTIFALVNLALIRIKRRGPGPDDAWSVPQILPYCGFLASTAFLVVELQRLLGA